MTAVQPQPHVPLPSELVIPPGSSWIGQRLRAATFARDHDVELLVVTRGDDALVKLARVIDGGGRLRV